jgi:ribose transport system ATP-binding protein
LLEVRALTKTFPGVRALGGVDLTVLPGQVHCLLGPNGAGKSTLIKCVSGVVAPTSGEVRFEGEVLPVGDPSASLARGIGTIYQELDLVGDLTVAGNVFLGHEPRSGLRLDRQRMVTATAALMERLAHPDISPHAPVGELKPASQQVVAIARALSRDVRLLIMDEPSAILDDREVQTLFQVVRRLVAERVGVIYISHRLEEVTQIGDTVTVLKDGRTVGTDLPPDTPASELVRLMVGTRPEALFPERPVATDQVLLEVEGLARLPMVRGVSLTLRAGEVLGITGLVGSGRTELLRLIYGLDVPTAGSVRVEGRMLPPGRPDRSIAAGLGMAPEERKSQGLLLDWSLTKNVSVADLHRFRRGPMLDLVKEREAASSQLRALNTQPPDPERAARLLSGGNQQKVVLARWLLHDCRVLLLDEPTRGVDVGAKTEIYRLIRDLAADGRGVLVVSSELPEVVGMCSRILVMRDGRVVAEAAGAEATEESLLSASVEPIPSSEEEVA